MGAAHFSAIFVEPRADELGDAFLTWLLHGTTPEYWFQIYERVADKDSVSQCDILHAMGDDAEDFAFAISLCHRLETFFGCRTFVAGAPTTGPASGADPDREAREAATEPPLSFSVSPVELFGALILLAGTGTPGMGGMGEGAPGGGVPRTPNSRFALLQQEFLTAAAASGLFVPVVAASCTSSVPAAGTTSSTSAAATGIAKASPFLNASANPLAWEYRRSPGMQKRYPGSFQAVAGTTYRVNEVYDLALGGANKIAMPAGASYPASGAGPRSCGDLQSDKRAALTSLAGGGPLLVAGSGGGEGGRGGEGHHAPPSFKDGKHHSKAALLTNHNQGAKQSAGGSTLQKSFAGNRTSSTTSLRGSVGEELLQLTPSRAATEKTLAKKDGQSRLVEHLHFICSERSATAITHEQSSFLVLKKLVALAPLSSGSGPGAVTGSGAPGAISSSRSGVSNATSSSKNAVAAAAGGGATTASTTSFSGWFQTAEYVVKNVGAGQLLPATRVHRPLDGGGRDHVLAPHASSGRGGAAPQTGTGRRRGNWMVQHVVETPFAVRVLLAPPNHHLAPAPGSTSTIQAGALKRGSNATAVGAAAAENNDNNYTAGVGKLREQRYQSLYEQLKYEPVHVRIQLLQSGKLCNSTTSTGSTSSTTTSESSSAILALLAPFGFGAAPGGGGGGGLAGGAAGAGGLTSSGATSKAALSRSASRAMIAEKSFHRAGSILTGSDQRRGSGGKRPHNRAAGGGGGGMTGFGYGSCGAGVAAAGNIAALMTGVAGLVVHAGGSGTIGNSTGTLTSDGGAGAANSAAVGAPPSTSSQLEWLLAHYLATLQAQQQQQTATMASAGASNKFAGGAGTRTPPLPAGTSTKKVSEPGRGGDSTVLNSVLDAVVFADLFRASRRRSGSCPAELRRPRGAQAPRGGGGQRQQQAVPDYLQPHSTYNTFNLRGSVANRGRVDAQSVRRVELLLHMARGRAMCSSNSTRRAGPTTSSYIRARGKRTTMWLSQLKTLLYQLHRGVLMFAHGSSPFAMDEVDHCLAPLLKKKAPTLLELSTEEALCLSVSSSSSADHKVVGSKNCSASSWCSRPFGGRSPAQFFQRAQGVPSSRPPAPPGQQLHRPGRGPGPPDFEFRVADFFDYLEHESGLLHERNWPASRVAFVQEGCALKLAQHRLLRIGRRLETIHGKKLVRNALTESTRSLEESDNDTNQMNRQRHDDVELYNINRVTDGGSKGHSSKNSKDQDLHDHGADGGSIANSSSAGLENVNVAGADQDRAAVIVRSGGVVGVSRKHLHQDQHQDQQQRPGAAPAGPSPHQLSIKTSNLDAVSTATTNVLFHHQQHHLHSSARSSGGNASNAAAPPTTTSSAKNGRVDQYEFAQLSWQKVQSVWSRVTALDDVLPKILDRARALCAERGVPFLLGGEPCGAAAVGAGGPGSAGAPGGGGVANHAVNATIGTPMIGGGPRNWNGGRGGGAPVESNRAGKPAGSTSRSTGSPTTTVSSTSADVSFEYRYADLNTYDLTLLLVPALVLDQLLITVKRRVAVASSAPGALGHPFGGLSPTSRLAVPTSPKGAPPTGTAGRTARVRQGAATGAGPQQLHQKTGLYGTSPTGAAGRGGLLQPMAVVNKTPATLTSAGGTTAQYLGVNANGNMLQSQRSYWCAAGGTSAGSGGSSGGGTLTNLSAATTSTACASPSSHKDCVLAGAQFLPLFRRLCFQLLVQPLGAAGGGAGASSTSSSMNRSSNASEAQTSATSQAQQSGRKKSDTTNSTVTSGATKIQQLVQKQQEQEEEDKVKVDDHQDRHAHAFAKTLSEKLEQQLTSRAGDENVDDREDPEYRLAARASLGKLQRRASDQGPAGSKTIPLEKESAMAEKRRKMENDESPEDDADQELRRRLRGDKDMQPDNKSKPKPATDGNGPRAALGHRLLCGSAEELAATLFAEDRQSTGGVLCTSASYFFTPAQLLERVCAWFLFREREAFHARVCGLFGFDVPTSRKQNCEQEPQLELRVEVPRLLQQPSPRFLRTGQVRTALLTLLHDLFGGMEIPLREKNALDRLFDVWLQAVRVAGTASSTSMPTEADKNVVTGLLPVMEKWDYARLLAVVRLMISGKVRHQKTATTYTGFCESVLQELGGA